MTYRDDEKALRERQAFLSKLRIATPCDATWDAMSGDRVRHCALCDRKVYDLSRMTSAEAIELLLSSGERLPCVRLHKRRDGTVLTSDCPRAVGRRKRRVALATAATACAAAAIAYREPIGDALVPPAFDPTRGPIVEMAVGAIEDLPATPDRATLLYNRDGLYLGPDVTPAREDELPVADPAASETRLRR